MVQERRRSRVHPWGRAGVTAALTVPLTLACGEAGGPFPGSADGLDDLGATVVEALNRDDAAALASVRLTMAEHNERVWPELPAARGDNPFPVDLAWRNIELRNQRAVSRLRQDLAPLTPMQFEAVQCRGETRAFDSFRVWTDCYTRVSHGGSSWEVQLFKDVLERDGGYKIFRYYDQRPRPVGGAD